MSNKLFNSNRFKATSHFSFLNEKTCSNTSSASLLLFFALISIFNLHPSSQKLRLPLVTGPLALASTEQKAFRLISNVMLNGSKCEERKEERRHLITRHVENRRAFKRPAFLKRHPPDPRVPIKLYTLHPIIDAGLACVN